VLVNSEKDDNFDENFVKIYANTDTRMKELGQILKTPKSRRIYQILLDQELHTKEIGIIIDKQPNPRLPNLTHHLKKMTKIGLLTSSSKIKNGHLLTYYKAIPMIMIVPEKHIEKAQTSKTLKNSLKKIFKIGMVGVVTFLAVVFSYENGMTAGGGSTGGSIYNIADLFVGIFIFILGLIVLNNRKWIWSKLRFNKH